MKHIVFYSGGIGSWMTAKRVIEQHGKENVILLFTDTLIEDEDLYRFIDETVAEMDVEYVYIAEGRDPWEVFKDVRFLGNSRLAQCSHLLKQKPAEEWLNERFKPHEVSYIKKKDMKKKTITYWEDDEDKARRLEEWETDEREPCKLYLGIDWSESHRRRAPIFNWAPYKVEFPLCEEPYMNKSEMLKELNDLGIATPRLYEMNFSHNNCGGFCVRGGQGHFANLLKHKPDLYKYHEGKEREMRDFLDKDVSILRRTKDGERSNLTLAQLREEIETSPEQIDMFDIGGCGCFVSDEDEE